MYVNGGDPRVHLTVDDVKAIAPEALEAVKKLVLEKSNGLGDRLCEDCTGRLIIAMFGEQVIQVHEKGLTGAASDLITTAEEGITTLEVCIQVLQPLAIMRLVGSLFSRSKA